MVEYTGVVDPKVSKIVKHRIAKTDGKGGHTVGVLELLFFSSGAIKITTSVEGDDSRTRTMFISRESAEIIVREIAFELSQRIKF